jgi:predicted permease
LEKLDNVPGVQHAAITSVLPLTGDSWGDMAQLPGDNRPLTQLPLESFRWTSPEYFATIRLPLVSGRFFTTSDWGKNVALISSKTAKTLWPGKNPIGLRFKRGGNPDEKPFTVIGVVADARTIALAKPDPMLIYVPYWFRCDNSAGLIVRTREDPAPIADAIRQTIWAIDRSVPVPAVRALGSIVADSVANQRFEMQLLLFFAASALFLAGLGVYGIVSYSVVQRHREIGLRLALGAQRGHVYRLVLREGLLPVVFGTVAGLAMAFSMARVVTSMLFTISPYDPLMTMGSAFVLLAVGAAACLVPAKRAAAADPMQALRAE